MATKICTFNCRGFNVCKVKHIETLPASCDILLVQEACALLDQVGKLNRYFDEYNTYGVSGINANELLYGRPYGGVSSMFKKIIVTKYRMGRNEQHSCVLHTIKY